MVFFVFDQQSTGCQPQTTSNLCVTVGVVCSTGRVVVCVNFYLKIMRNDEMTCEIEIPFGLCCCKNAIKTIFLNKINQLCCGRDRDRDVRNGRDRGDADLRLPVLFLPM